jgi:hypothetical protein
MLGCQDMSGSRSRMYLSVNSIMAGATCKLSGFQRGAAPEHDFPGILHFTTGSSELKTLSVCSWPHLEGHPWIWGWVGPTAVLDGLEKRKIFADCLGFLGCHAIMPCHWSLNPWRWRHWVPLKCQQTLQQHTAAFLNIWTKNHDSLYTHPAA